MQQYLLYFFRNIKRSGLVNEVVQPVGVEQLGGRAPADQGRLFGVVIWEVVVGDIDIDSPVYITEVFVG